MEHKNETHYLDMYVAAQQQLVPGSLWHVAKGMVSRHDGTMKGTLAKDNS